MKILARFRLKMALTACLSSGVLGVLSLVGAVQVAEAQEARGIAAVLADLKWTDGPNVVLKNFRAQKKGEFKAEAQSLKDPLLREELRKKKQAEVKRISNSKTLFKGGKTGYEVSVIAGEFKTDSGESMLRMPDSKAQKYYFFLDDRLWKLAVAYNTDAVKGIDFETFIDMVSAKYGDPVETVFDDKAEFLQRAIWRDARTELRIEDKSDFYGTFVMVFSDLAVLKRRDAVAKAFADTSSDGISITDEIKDIQEDDGFGVESDIVDQIVGTTVEVDLSRGRAAEKKLRRVGEITNPADDKKKRKKRKRKAKKARKASNDLIIY